jgi:hypothetical protein
MATLPVSKIEIPGGALVCRPGPGQFIDLRTIETLRKVRSFTSMLGGATSFITWTNALIQFFVNNNAEIF